MLECSFAISCSSVFRKYRVLFLRNVESSFIIVISFVLKLMKISEISVVTKVGFVFFEMAPAV